MSERLGRTAAGLSLSLAVAWVALGCVREEPEPLRILAAASLTEVVSALAEQDQDTDAVASFGSSSALARQIRDGAPADLFVSASPQWIDFLRAAGALAGEPVVLARNRLVAIAPAGGSLAPAGIDDPRALLEAIGSDGRVAIADEGVPAGEYARSALEQLGLLQDYLPHLVGQSDVRAVLHAVEQGELPAGFVYSTDARLADVEILFAFEPSTHPPIEYQAAALRNAADPVAAQRFLDHLQGELARDLLTRSGFEVP